MTVKKILSAHTLVFFLGCLSSFSLPPYNLIFINFFSYSLFLYLIIYFKENNLSKKNFFLIGFVFGYGYFISSLYWISHSLSFDPQLYFLKPFAIFGIPILLSIFYGLSILLIHSFIKKNYLFLLIFSISLASFEYFRGFVFYKFPWNLIVYSLSSSLESIQILKFIGTYSLNFLCIFIFSIYFLCFQSFHIKKFLLITLINLFIISSNFILGSFLIHNSQTHTIDEFKIRVIQPNVNILDTLGYSNENKNILRLLSLSKVQKNQKYLIVWPEGMLQETKISEFSIYKKYFNHNFSVNNFVIIGGINSVLNAKKPNYFNSMALVDHDAKILNVYNKITLVPFGEFIPFENLLSRFKLKKITFGYSSFSSGTVREEIKLFNNTFLPLICYEVIFSGDLNPSKKKYDFIINISEDGWFGNSIGPYQHLNQIVFRAVEEGKPIVRSANKGVSAFISPNGQVLKSIDLNSSGFFDLNLTILTKPTLFSQYGNLIFYFIILLSVIVVLFIKKLNKNE